MIREVPVENLPDGLSFPSDLAGRVQYDASRHKLAFDGFMSKATFDRLYRLAEDREYRRALEELFQLCTFDDSDLDGQGRGRLFVRLVIVLACIAIAVALLMQLSP